ncbi:MAG: methyltransferase domain-containing protein [Deltaproteobacteria bacterium]|nr:methyltransferase domain-containing protein [Deltaproteobacteria bacterium]
MRSHRAGGTRRESLSDLLLRRKLAGRGAARPPTFTVDLVERLARSHRPARTRAGYKTGSFERFLAWTDQKQLTGRKLRSLVPRHAGRMLDVGAGDGSLTKHYDRPFREAVLLEPDERLRGRLAKWHPRREIVGDTIEAFLRSDRREFDFIVASHVLQHVERPYDVLYQLIDRLSPGGSLALVMLDPKCDWHRYVEQFRERVSGDSTAPEIPWTDVADDLRRRGVPFEIELIPAKLRPPSIEAMLTISDFAFASARALPDALRGEIEEYLRQHVHDGRLVLSQDNKVLLIRKPSSTPESAAP